MAGSILSTTSKPARISGADAALAALVISVVALMILPLPTWLLDVLLATNLAISVVILLVALYVGDALKIAAFPTILLITTLIRLSLNVSSTRLILLQANAGEVINAFGNFVVSGNYVVGAVIFLILSIIQFVVIAKGSERVAEVGARFTLDAMPGKQMAIDAELRSGAIDGQTAKKRRSALSRESQFYGAMDGAMKFVKGDVIASFLITLINILGGLAIGVLQRDMEVGSALKRYGLLTIGDGLVTQIPSLVIATAAGVLVTRVASEEPDVPLGTELKNQIFGQPRALRVGAIFVVLLAMVPGLPAVPFLVIGGLLFFASHAQTRPARAGDPPRAPGSPAQAAPAAPKFVPVVEPWSVDVSPDLARLMDDEIKGGELKRAGLRSAVAAFSEIMFRELGVPLPPGRIQVQPSLPARRAVISIHEIPARALALHPDVPDQDLAEHFLVNALDVFRARAADFIGIAETQGLLDQLEQIAPATVRQVVPKPIAPPLLSEILRRLVEEGVSIRDLRLILESLAQVSQAERDPLHLSEFVRAQLRRPITHSLTGGAPGLEVLLLEPSIEETVRSSVSRTPAGSFLTLAPAAARDIVSAVRRAVGKVPSGVRPVILTQPDIRRFFKKLVEVDLPNVRVVSYAELLPEVNIRPVATASLVGI
jgi:type III secretion protein V